MFVMFALLGAFVVAVIMVGAFVVPACRKATAKPERREVAVPTIVRSRKAFEAYWLEADERIAKLDNKTLNAVMALLLTEIMFNSGSNSTIKAATLTAMRVLDVEAVRLNYATPEAMAPVDAALESLRKRFMESLPA